MTRRRCGAGMLVGAALLGGVPLGGCGEPRLDLESDAGARAARKYLANSVLLGPDTLARELRTPKLDDYRLAESGPDTVEVEAKGSGMSLVQVVTVLRNAAEAARRFEQVAGAHAAAKDERQEIPSPGPPGSRAFSVLFPYWDQATPPPAVIVVAYKKRFVARVHVFAASHEAATNAAGRLLSLLLSRM